MTLRVFVMLSSNATKHPVISSLAYTRLNWIPSLTVEDDGEVGFHHAQMTEMLKMFHDFHVSGEPVDGV